MSGRQPEERVGVTSLSQRWRDVLFLHWPVAPDAIARLLPDGLEPDVLGEDAWVSLTAFEVRDARAGGVIPIDNGPFAETNLRTYAIGPDGRDGIFFFALDVGNAPSVLGGRTAGAPYHYARMHIDRRDDTIRYRSARLGSRSVGHDISARPGGGLRSHGLRDDWLTGRWRAWTTVGGGLAAVAVQHQPWDLQHAEVLDCHETLRVAHGLPDDDPPAVVHHSPGVDARLSLPRRPRAATQTTRTASA
jgi:uncharacterized protein YqjF (DUF2071 family)